MPGRRGRSREEVAARSIKRVSLGHFPIPRQAIGARVEPRRSRARTRAFRRKRARHPAVGVADEIKRFGPGPPRRFRTQLYLLGGTSRSVDLYLGRR